MAEVLRISDKNLGALALPDFCPQCFWLKTHARHLPYQIFPGIFSSIDAYTKRGVPRGELLAECSCVIICVDKAGRPG